MKVFQQNGITSVILRLKLRDSASGGPKTGLGIASAGLIISTIAENEATATVYTAAGSTIETITTLGTFATPTATKCRFKEVDATNHPGLYEIQIANARLAVASARSMIVSVQATGIVAQDAEVQLVGIDVTAAAWASDVTKWAGTATTLTSGLPDVNTKTIAAGIIAAATFAGNALDAVWSATTRLLTAGTNIVLAKG